MVGRGLSLPARLWFWRSWEVVGRVDAADEIPDRIQRKGAILVGDFDAPTWIAFDCPCSERHRVMLNTDRRRRPTWTIDNGQPLTLSPSVDEVRTSKRCHYLIKRGRIRWAGMQ